MKYLFLVVLILSILGCDSSSPEELMKKYQKSIAAQDLSKLQSLYAKGHYQCNLNAVNFPDTVEQFQFELSSMTNEDIKKYKMINSSEVTKEIKFAEYLQKGLSYKEAGKETFKYLTNESNPRKPFEFKLIPSHQAKVTMQFTQNSDKNICTSNNTKRMTLYISQSQGQYKFIEPMCDVKLATANATAVSKNFQESFTKKINLDSLKDKYKNEGLMGIKNYAKENNIPQAIVFEIYNTRICPSF